MALEEALGVQVQNMISHHKVIVQQNEMILYSDVKMELTNLHEEDLLTEESFKDYMSIFMLLLFSTLKNGPSIHLEYLPKWNGLPWVHIFVGKI
jgi:hypothetical protein